MPFLIILVIIALLIIYYVIKKQKKKKTNFNDVICCDHCGTDNPAGAKKCKKCQRVFR